MTTASLSIVTLPLSLLSALEEETRVNAVTFHDGALHLILPDEPHPGEADDDLEEIQAVLDASTLPLYAERVDDRGRPTFGDALVRLHLDI
jgi:hypothetical protein